MKPKQNRHYTGRPEQNGAAELVDELARFEKFKQDVLPELRDDIRAGLTASEIMKKYSALAAARTITTVALEVDSGKALAAAKDILDRAEGKPKERVEHTHRYDQLTDDELDAQVLARAQEMADKATSKKAVAQAVSPAGGAKRTLQ